MSLQDFPLSELALVCSFRVDALRALADDAAPAPPVPFDAAGRVSGEDHIKFLFC
jgi:hypothetical protein